MKHISTFSQFLNEQVLNERDQPWIKEFTGWTPQKGTIQEYLFDMLTLARDGGFNKKEAKKLSKWYKSNKHLEPKNSQALVQSVVGAEIVQKMFDKLERRVGERERRIAQLGPKAAGSGPEEWKGEMDHIYYYYIKSLAEASDKYPFLTEVLKEGLINEANYIKKYANWKPKKGTSAETLFNLLADLEAEGADDFDFDNVQTIVDELSANSKNPKALTEIGDNIERAVNTLQDYEEVEDNEGYDEDSEEYEEWEYANDDWQDAKFYTIQLIAKLKE